MEDKEYNIEVGERIKKRRQELNLSQTELAYRLGYQYRSTISKMEKGGYAFKPTTIISVADALHTTPSYLSGWTDDPFDYEAWLNDAGDSIPDGFREDLTDPFDRAKAFYKFKKAEKEDYLDELANIKPVQQSLIATTIKIPVYGTVPAGIPIEANEDIQDYIDIPEDWTKHGQYIGLKVSGSSMYPKYLDGDTVIVRVQSDCENKQDAVVYVNGFEATLKTVIKENDGTITLQPINPEYQSHNYGPGDAPIRILGVVKELRRTI